MRTPLCMCLTWVLLGLLGCQGAASQSDLALDLGLLARLPPGGDPHSASTPWLVRVSHLDLDLDLDFEHQRLHGSAVYRLQRTDPQAPLILDTAALDQLAVYGLDGRVRPFKLGPKRDRLGKALIIELEPADQALRIIWSTRPEGEALQWLGKNQTASRAQPFMYSQGQAVLTRSWLPIQDTPSNRVTWSAKVRAPPEPAKTSVRMGWLMGSVRL